MSRTWRERLNLHSLAERLRTRWPKTQDVRHSASCRSSHELDRTRAERLQAVLAGMTDGVMMLDPDLRLVEWNSHFSEFTGVPEDMLQVGLPIADILRAQAVAGEFGQVDVEVEVARRVALLQAGKSSGTIERTRPNGRVMELRRNPLPNGGFVTLYTDITARRQAEEKLRQAQKMEAVGHLTGGVAHDFNNLLMIILGNLEIAERSLKASNVDKAALSIDVARGGARRAASLTQRLLAFSRKRPSEPQPIDVNTLVSELSELIRQSATSKIAVELALSDHPWMTLADPNQFEIALLNLVINARDAMPKGGAVTIETGKVTRGSATNSAPIPIPGSEFVKVTVRDTGVGMPREVVERACEPFFTTKGPSKGTGLGLHQVADFTTQAGGHVKIESEPGIGTAVTMYLPRLESHDPAEESYFPSDDTSRYVGRGETILVVENEPAILAYTAEGLEVLGYRVLGAQDASSALTLLETTPEIAVLFTDCGLPGIDGRQLAAEARRRWPNLPLLYTSGALEDAASLGSGSDYIIKPYGLPKLARKIRVVLDQRLSINVSTP